MKNPIPHIILVIVSVFSTILSVPIAQTQQLTLNQSNTIRKTIVANVGTEANQRTLELGKSSFLPIGKDTYYNLHGLRFVFKLKGDSAIRLDRSIYHGSNFNRFLFQHGDRIMCLGGYGHFVTNNNLEAFNTTSREWYLIHTTGDVPKTIKGSCIQTNNYIYVLNNCIDGNNLAETKSDEYFYRLDLNDFRWTKYKEFRKDFIKTPVHDFFYLKDYIVAKGEIFSFIYNLKTREYIYRDFEALGIRPFLGNNVNIDHNILKIDSTIPSPGPIKFNQLDLDKLWSDNVKFAQPLMLEPTIFQQYPNEFYGLFFGLLILVLGLISYFKLQKKKTRNSAVHPLVTKILLHPQTSLTLDELDTLLEIAHMEGESKKTKRHRLLTLIDGQYPGLIERQKDSTDKRRFLYYIHKNAD